MTEFLNIIYKMTLNVAISIHADDVNISGPPGSLDIANAKLNNAVGLLEPWFQKMEDKD
jgi:hypothetical protein